MRILLASFPFYPSVGGIEGVTALLAEAFVKRGHTVVIVTMTQAEKPDVFPYKVLRQPTTGELIRALRRCDVFLQANVSLRLGWPNFLLRRPCVIALHSNLDAEEGKDGTFAWKSHLKRCSLRFANQVVAVSAAVAQRTYPRALVIGNPFRRSLFRRMDERRSYELVFLGRLVSDKGVVILIEALSILAEQNLRPSLLIIGSGPEEMALRKRCHVEGLASQVHFAGTRRDEALVTLLNQAKIMVIPSIWEEPFGIVALEGIACGCVVVAARAGGLSEAVGPCGVLVPKSDPHALAAALRSLLCDPAAANSLREGADAHLSRYDPDAIADCYLRVLADACGRPA